MKLPPLFFLPLYIRYCFGALVGCCFAVGSFVLSPLSFVCFFAILYISLLLVWRDIRAMRAACATRPLVEGRRRAYVSMYAHACARFSWLRGAG